MKRVIGGRAGLHPRSPVRVVERETPRCLAAGSSPCRAAGPGSIRSLSAATWASEKLSQHGPATVRRTASQPAVADGGCGAELRRRDRVLVARSSAPVCCHCDVTASPVYCGQQPDARHCCRWPGDQQHIVRQAERPGHQRLPRSGRSRCRPGTPRGSRCHPRPGRKPVRPFPGNRSYPQFPGHCFHRRCHTRHPVGRRSSRPGATWAGRLLPLCSSR